MKIKTTLFKYFVSILIFAAPLSMLAKTSFKGQVVYNNENRTPLRGVEVLLKNTDGVIVASQFTDENGNYEFKNIEKAVYVVDGRYDAEPGGVDFEDLHLILKHLFGVIKLNGISYLASDVDGSGVVDWNDYWHFLIDWFMKGEEFKGGKWVFLSRIVDLTGTGMKALQTDIMSANGDGVGDFEPGTKNKNINPELIYAGTISSSSTDYYEIPIKYSGIESVGGFGIVLNFSDNVVIEGITSQIENLNYSFENSVLRVSWINTNLSMSTLDADAPLFVFKTRIMELEPGQQVFSLSNESHLININGDRIDGAKLTMPQIVSEIENTQPELKGIYPNPVRNNAKIEYKLAVESDVCLTLYNSNGQKIAELVRDFQSSGIYLVDVNVNNLNLVNGTYVYRLDCSGEQKYSESKILVVCQ